MPAIGIDAETLDFRLEPTHTFAVHGLADKLLSELGRKQGPS